MANAETDDNRETKTKEKKRETEVTETQATGKTSAAIVTDRRTDRLTEKERVTGAKSAFSSR